MIVIRAATEIDIVFARSLSERVFAELRRFYRPTVPASADDSANCVVAEADGRIVGTVQYAIESDRLHLWQLAVDPDFRRIGIARALLGHLQETAIAAGLRALSLNTIKQTGNVAAFESLGFRGVREEPATWAISPHRDSLIDVRMERPIGGAPKQTF